MRLSLSLCAAVLPLLLGAHAASAATASQTTTFLNKATSTGQAMVMKVMKAALKNVSNDATFQGKLNNVLGYASQASLATQSVQSLSNTYNKEVAALKAKTSLLAPADQAAAAVALKAAYQYAVSTNGVTATDYNVISVKDASGQGSTHKVSFVVSNDAATRLQTGATATALGDLQKYWSGQVTKSTGDLTNSFSQFFVTAFVQNMSADSLGCKGFSGYYTGTLDTTVTPNVLKSPVASGC